MRPVSTVTMTLTCLAAALSLAPAGQAAALAYPVVDTGQTVFYGNGDHIDEPAKGAAFYGQDAHHTGNQPSYTDNGDGTVTDNVTGLMWQQSPDLNGDGEINIDDKLTWDEAMDGADSFDLAGYGDWRLPTIKELYSLIMFTGLDPSGWNGTDSDNLTPFIDTTAFTFGFGDTDAGERLIDSQFATSTLYVGTTMGGAATMFGVNFADGRIKGYPIDPMPGQTEGKLFYVLHVRGDLGYGVNDFADNGDGTITDNATGLMWSRTDNGEAVDWEHALDWVQRMNEENHLGYSDWRLPDIKELQSIVDYTRSPATTDSPAIDPLFTCTEIVDEGGAENYPFYWSGTTHATLVAGSSAAYVAFGEALGWMRDPFGRYQLMDVHGAGAQRSDPKTGDPDDYPYGHGPQGDVIRIYNYVRLVRDADPSTTGVEKDDDAQATDFTLHANHPNPFNPRTVIRYDLARPMKVNISIYNPAGQRIAIIVEGLRQAGEHAAFWDGRDDRGGNVASGMYLYTLTAGGTRLTHKMTLVR